MEAIFSSVQVSHSVVSDSLRPHESQHARPPCPSATPGVHSDSRPLSQWCHPAISSSVVPFSSCPQSLPASESFPMSQLFAWGGQSIGVILVPIKRRMGKDVGCVCTHTHITEYYSATKNEILLFINDNMDGPREYYAKQNKSEKDKYCMISVICGIWKTKQMNKQNRNSCR